MTTCLFNPSRPYCLYVNNEFVWATTTYELAAKAVEEYYPNATIYKLEECNSDNAS